MKSSNVSSIIRDTPEVQLDITNNTSAPLKITELWLNTIGFVDKKVFPDVPLDNIPVDSSYELSISPNWTYIWGFSGYMVFSHDNMEQVTIAFSSILAGLNQSAVKIGEMHDPKSVWRDMKPHINVVSLVCSIGPVWDKMGPDRNELETEGYLGSICDFYNTEGLVNTVVAEFYDQY
jgi:hypothetical protein